MNEKVGVYICHCGTNIAGTIDVEEVGDLAREQPQVAIARGISSCALAWVRN